MPLHNVATFNLLALYFHSHPHDLCILEGSSGVEKMDCVLQVIMQTASCFCDLSKLVIMACLKIRNLLSIIPGVCSIILRARVKR